MVSLSSKQSKRTRLHGEIILSVLRTCLYDVRHTWGRLTITTAITATITISITVAIAVSVAVVVDVAVVVAIIIIAIDVVVARKLDTINEK